MTLDSFIRSPMHTLRVLQMATAPGFYTLAAEIIPVLFIAVLLQGNLYDTSKATTRERVFIFSWTVGTIIVAFFSELAALHTVDIGRATAVSRALTLSGLLTLGILLVSAVFWRFYFAIFPGANRDVGLRVTSILITAISVFAAIYISKN